MLRLRDIMTTDLVALSPTTTLRDAADVLASHHIGGAPVLDNGMVVGIVSATDILTFAASPPARIETEPEGDDDWDVAADRARWEEEEDPPACWFTDRWSEAEDDVADRFAASDADAGDTLDTHRVEEVMTRDVVALPAMTEVSAAAARMRTADVHRLLVTERGRLVGIVTTTDVARAVADGRVGRRTFVFDRSPMDRDHEGGEF